jgi:hypothetical protein
MPIIFFHEILEVRFLHVVPGTREGKNAVSGILPKTPEKIQNFLESLPSPTFA